MTANLIHALAGPRPAGAVAMSAGDLIAGLAGRAG
jgi:hypothetical protein